MALREYTSTQSIEPNIADLVQGWLKSYELDYKLEQEPLSSKINKVLNKYFSKKIAQMKTFLKPVF